MDDVFFGVNRFIGPATITIQCGRGGKGRKTISTLDLKPTSAFYITVECPHGQREIRWNHRYQKCHKCAAEAGEYNTSPKGRIITWGNKISKVKKGVKFTDEHKKALSIAQYGVTEDEWPGFIERDEKKKIRDSVEYLDFRKKIMERDNYTCVISGMTGHLEVHHIDSFNCNPDKRFDANNVVTLHRSVHTQFHLSYGQGNNTRLQFEEFKQKWSEKKSKIVFLCGQSGSGKSTIAVQLSDKFTVVSYDEHKKDLDSAILVALRNDKPVLLDIPILISTYYKKYSLLAHIDMVFLIESEYIVESRLMKRNGHVKNLNQRYKRLKSLADKYATFQGNTEKVLEYLRSF